MDPVVSQPQFASPAVTGPDLGSTEGEGVARVVVGNVARVEDDLQVIVDISLQSEGLREFERPGVRDVVRRLHHLASLCYGRHLSLNQIIKYSFLDQNISHETKLTVSASSWFSL